MKTRLFKLMAAMALLLTAIPMHSQNYLKIWFKDGHTERHFMHLVQNISATKYDLEGNLHSDYQMQQIVMPDTTYSYYIADIDSMSFRKVDEEQIVKDAINVASIVESIYEQCSTIKDIEQYLDFLNTLEEVEYAYTTETDLVVQLRDSKKVFYHFIDVNEEKRHGVNRRYISKTSKQKTNGSFKVPITNSNYKIAIAFQMVGDEEWESEKELLLSLKEDLLSMGFSVTFFGDKEDDQLFDIAFYEENMFDYDIVLLDTHGCYEKDKHWLMSAEKFESYNDAYNAIHGMYEFVTDIDDVVPRFHPIMQSKKTRTYYFPLISEDFFSRFVNSFKHSERTTPPSQNFNPTIIFNGACESLKGNDFVYRNIDGEENKYDISTSLSSIFLYRKNADLYLGYNESNSYCEKAYTSILKDMLNGYSIKQAYNNLELKYKNEKHGKYDATLLQFPENKNYFLVKTHTNQISSEELKEELRNKKIVTIKGVTTIAHRTESGIKYGFKYGADETLVDFTTVYATTIIDVDSPYGNVEFSLALEPKPGQTVYYQAFTYDGLHYNYGDTFSFTIYNPFELSENSISLQLGNVGNIRISSGSGSYEAISSNPEVATASISDSKDGHATLLIQPHKVDTATITVIDTKSGYTATIDVTVINDQEVTMEQYEAAKAGIEENGTYHIYTQFNGTSEDSKKYYLKDDGYLTDSETEAHVFTFGLVEGTNLFVSPGWKLDIPFSNPHLSNGATGTLPLHGHIRVDWGYNRNDWEGQVWYKQGDYYAVRSTNAVSEEWGANTFWTVLDSDANGLPEADYSLTPKFVWKLETIEVKPDPIITSCPDDNHPHLIDLGLSDGTKWACCNVDASKPEGYGGYYAWGEIKEKNDYSWGTYKHCDNGSRYECHNIGGTISHTKNDVAYVKWGSSWQMPTYSQMYCLYKECTQKTISVNGVEGKEFTGPNGNKIFLPFAGRKEGSISENAGKYGIYWSGATKDEGYDPDAYQLQVIYYTDAIYLSTDRYKGCTIRPVFSENTDAQSCPDSNHPHLIDLGLPSGTKWACCNVGATVPGDFGSYYAWGETSEKATYNSDTYQYNNENLDVNIAGSYYDVAKAQWGSSWQMPSESQIKELLNYCSSKRTTLNGVNGFEFVGTNGGRIFLPSAGIRTNNDLSLADSEGHYWSSTRLFSSPEYAYYLNFNSYEKELKGIPRTYGLSVRPVYKGMEDVSSENDYSNLVGTNASAWNAGGMATWAAPEVTTSDGRTTAMAELYVETVSRTGIVLEQTVTGLPNGTYNVELYANAYYTDGRGFSSNVTEGQMDMVYLFANDTKQYIPVHIGTEFKVSDEYTLTAIVVDGTLHMGMYSEKEGTNWWTIQIKSLSRTGN